MMKSILFLMTDLGGGGAQKALVELLKSVDYNCYKVSLCLVYYRGIYLSEIPEEVDVFYLCDSDLATRYPKAIKYYVKRKSVWRLFVILNLKIKRWKYDIIISFMEGEPLLFHRFIVNRGRVNISWIHCDLYSFHYTADCFLEPITEIGCYKKMDKIFFVSQISKNNFDKLFDINVPKFCLYNVLDIDKIRESGESKIVHKQSFTITAIGALKEVKGFDRLIRVAKKLKDDGYTFCIWIIGEGDLEANLKKTCSNLGVLSEVHFWGFQKCPYSYLKQSDLLVSTSLSEGLPYVICEAFALGVPVVATKTAGAVELLDNGKYGVLTEHDDLSIYQALKMMIDCEKIRDAYREKAKERSEHFGIEKLMDKFYSLLE